MRTIASIGGWGCFIKQILHDARFLHLAQIGGGRKYHREGNALTHTFLVFLEAMRMWPTEPKMWVVALLHDIGKLKAYYVKENGDWSYPQHAAAGVSMLSIFYPMDLDHYDEVRWYIGNHIKPLTWRNETYDRQTAKESLRGPVTDEMFDNLVRLAICDLRGSITADERDKEENIKYLQSLLS